MNPTYTDGFPFHDDFAQRWGYATLWVTFTDGNQIAFEDVRFALRRDVSDPIKVDGTTLRVEDRDKEYTILGVRYFTLEHK